MKRYVLAIFSLIVVTQAPATLALAKPLYITVPRAYGSTEQISVDVAFSGTDPVEIRVVKPDDLDKYIEQQANLRRAYDEPATRNNPGYYLALGINNVKSPGAAFLDALDPEMRRKVASSLPVRTDATYGKRFGDLDEGMKKIVDIPPNTTLVRRNWLNLDLGGQAMSFTVPGFDTGGSGSGFEQRKVTLDPLPPGLYVLQVLQGAVEGQVTLVISDMSVQVKQTDGEVLVRVADANQRPVSGAEARLHTPSGKNSSVKTDSKGEAHLTTDEPRVIISVHRDKDLAIVDTDFYSSLTVTPDVFIYADRPIYKPGDTIQFRGIVRKPATFLASLFTLKKSLVTVSLTGDGAVSRTARVGVDDFGCFAGALQVEESAEAGIVRLVAAVEDKWYQSEARVQQYVKPTFFVEVKTDQDTITPGGKLTAKLKVERYAGGVPEGVVYEVFVYKTRVEAPTWIDDAGMGAQGSAVTYGSASTTEGKLTVPERVYSSLAARDASEGDDAWESAATFDEKGEASIAIEIPTLDPGEDDLPFKYSLTIRARDKESSIAATSKAFYLGKCSVTGNVVMTPRLVLQDTAGQLAVRATTLGGKPLANVTGEVELISRSADESEKSLGKQAITTDATGVWRTAVKASTIGAVEARVMLKDDKGNPWSGEASLLVVGTHGEPVIATPTLAADSVSGGLSPGDTGKMVVMFPAAWGAEGAESGPVWITLSGRGIYETKLVAVNGRTYVHDFTAEKRFGSGVYASVSYPTASGRWEERTVTYRIVPKERVLTVQVAPEKVELPPLTEQTLRLSIRDSDGKGQSAQVSVGVVDKAIYALQAEFRPRVTDFFYPPVRNNVMTFYSAEFQGYGYGEVLAQMARGRGYRFAAIKPPVKKIDLQERDTAYWNPSVVTDASGDATLRFKMPSNPTIWVVTALAVDADGRFGESTHEFASRSGLTFSAALPPFLRNGDTARGFVRLNRDKKPQSGLSLSVA
ncbi:MAG: alpha-2-macroglobulin, partial [Clostridia bacterium]|nr:alpha-2-macroglobulin [Deltaproteobacteria bacterium]